MENFEIFGYPLSTTSVETIRDEPRMVGGERQRAYRYGMTLLCVGALFNWLGMNDSSNSDPIKFIGYTCLASGALLICMAICFWANANSSVHHRAVNQVRPSGTQQDMMVSIIERGRMHREKPPDYDAVADLSPPPSYDDAIRLSPAYLPATSHAYTSHSTQESAPEYSVTCTVVDETAHASNQATSSNDTSNENNKSKTDSALTRVFRLSSRFLRRSQSSVDRRPAEEETPPIRRTSSVQDLKNT